MQCPRIDHFVKLHPPNPFDVIRMCCHMTNAPSFKDYETMMASSWTQQIRDTFDAGQFPEECVRCKIAEDSNQYSIRQASIEEHNKQTKKDYLVADIMLDNLCNLGCQFCSPMASSKIGALNSPNRYIVHDNVSHFDKLPLDRITQIDLAGGEPSYSKNIKNLLTNLPPNVNSLRVNTNCTTYMDEIIPLLDKGFNISISISLDGVEKIQEYVRWPIKWDKFCNVLNQYKDLQTNYPDNLSLSFWTTINALNINDFNNIKSFADSMNISFTYSLLQMPAALNIKYKNKFTLKAKEDNIINDIFGEQLACDTDNQQSLDNFISKQDRLRGINSTDFLS
jgi:sulfatase maturation enzyme AslB (radical SAM superfamily)